MQTEASFSRVAARPGRRWAVRIVLICALAVALWMYWLDRNAFAQSDELLSFVDQLVSRETLSRDELRTRVGQKTGGLKIDESRPNVDVYSIKGSVHRYDLEVFYEKQHALPFAEAASVIGISSLPGTISFSGLPAFLAENAPKDRLFARRVQLARYSLIEALLERLFPP
jgi:hypothetical protein